MRLVLFLAGKGCTAPMLPELHRRSVRAENLNPRLFGGRFLKKSRVGWLWLENRRDRTSVLGSGRYVSLQPPSPHDRNEPGAVQNSVKVSPTVERGKSKSSK
jgi:hypothetical protein